MKVDRYAASVYRLAMKMADKTGPFAFALTGIALVLAFFYL